MSTQGMTDRDKKLLYMLGFIVIIFLFVIVADRPLFRKIRATNAEIAREQDTHDTIELKLSRKELLNTYKEQIDERVDKYVVRYYPMMDSTQVDDLLTGYVLGEGLKAVNLFIDMPKDAVILPPYPYSNAAGESEETFDSEDAYDSSDPDIEQVEAFTNSLNSGEMIDVDESAEMTDNTALSGVYAAGVNLTAFGAEAKLKSLLDKLMADQSLRVVSYQWQEAPGAGFSYVDGELIELDETDKQLSVSLQVFMYDEDAYVDTMPAADRDEDVQTQ